MGECAVNEDFDPDRVGSILWRLGSDGKWSTRDHSGMQGDTIETVEVGDYNNLLAMYNDVKGKYDWMRKDC